MGELLALYSSRVTKACAEGTAAAVAAGYPQVGCLVRRVAQGSGAFTTGE